MTNDFKEGSLERVDKMYIIGFNFLQQLHRLKCVYTNLLP